MAESNYASLDEIDDIEDDGSISPITYDVSSYGSDPEVESLVNRLNRGAILIPAFQRNYVWTISDASRFIESLLLGLPVPGIFLAQDKDNRQLVIDGQQRLKSLQFFYDGFFNPQEGNKTQKVFALTRVQEAYEGRTYQDLEERDRIRLDTSIIHATIVKQLAPGDDDTSLFHVFERLNSGGSRLSDQEIRVALYHGPFIDFVHGINENPSWRNIYGRESIRLKDQELIIRFLALFDNALPYSKPMKEFINKFCGRNQYREEFLDYEKAFTSSIELFDKAIGKSAFRPEKNFNAAAFDSCMIGLSTALANGLSPDAEAVADAYSRLMVNEEYREAISKATSDEKQVLIRAGIASNFFMDM
ncbi:DUF262 domain-containing protein [Eggerthella guodeyinii]|uniref:DUF262 domain-containing protein n=1 Tax=Eggerthella guodeyinii TaxID=2690837 RepID=A0A6L7IXQ0_9ACTN|nr:DUF262 domain-containing protein [Eggerthella guodeyinii]QOS67111.1 DUF262 domain-containing protein [Eggerthella guodeyinii]